MSEPPIRYVIECNDGIETTTRERATIWNVLACEPEWGEKWDHFTYGWHFTDESEAIKFADLCAAHHIENDRLAPCRWDWWIDDYWANKQEGKS